MIDAQIRAPVRKYKNDNIPKCVNNNPCRNGPIVYPRHPPNIRIEVSFPERLILSFVHVSVVAYKGAIESPRTPEDNHRISVVYSRKYKGTKPMKARIRLHQINFVAPKTLMTKLPRNRPSVKSK